ncbi:ribotoxin [Diplodia corticola]|uniref:Ribotoxin n=1 Tax=Diplodia corticola TaxID=236234 RepID=A0A1J9QXJ9_9PEZI|nr:ribotoxin [Diplodia corticola]OJD33105.1 ribotoxin [Diplodia corticola]
MHAVKSICYLLFAVNAAAIPMNQTLGLEARDKTLLCRNTKGDVKISQGKAEGNIHAAPVVDPKVKSQKPKSGYPHGYGNNDGIKWPNSKCNDKNAELLEFPVYADGHLFPYNEKKTNLDPGIARGIFTYPSKDFCGVMAHKDGNSGPFALCE